MDLNCKITINNVHVYINTYSSPLVALNYFQTIYVCSAITAPISIGCDSD